MHVYIYIYIYIYIYTYIQPTGCFYPPPPLLDEAQKCPLRRSALSVCPCGVSWGDNPPTRD